ncbi:MAG: methyltransferase domain-containing protein [SAR324 cluster bacterium]|nr:methyltransferase domain-containing protein [SAR324 cluster bacterium]
MEIYNPPGDSIAEASHRTMKRICAKPSGVDEGARVLDIESGYAGTARHLARTYGCHVTGSSISEVENERRCRMNEEQGLDHLIAVVDGTCEDIPFEDDSFDAVMVPGRHAAQRQSRQAARRGSSRAPGGRGFHLHRSHAGRRLSGRRPAADPGAPAAGRHGLVRQASGRPPRRIVRLMDRHPVADGQGT